MYLSRVRVLVIALFACLVLADCAQPPSPTPGTTALGGAGPASSSTSSAPQVPAEKALTRISVRLSWIAEGYDAPAFLARKKGWFEEEGLDVQIGEGNGSGTVAKLIGNKSDDVGYADSATVAKAIATGVPVKVVAGIFQRSPLSTIFRKDSGIKTPKDLEGKQLGEQPGSGTSQIMPAFFKLAGVNKDKVKIVTVDPAAQSQTLLSGRIDAFNSYAMENVPILNIKLGGDADAFEWADYGVNVLGMGVIVHQDTIKERPEIVRGYLKALARGWQQSIEDPEGAVAALQEAFPRAGGGDAIAAKEQLTRASKKLHTKATENKLLFWMTREDWESTQAILAEYADLKGTRPVEEYYSNDFVPMP